MDIKINDAELGQLTITEEAGLVRLIDTVKQIEEITKPSLATLKSPEKVIPQSTEEHIHIVAVF